MADFTLLNRFRRSPVLQPITMIILFCFTILSCNSCVSIKVTNIPLVPDQETPSIAMRMYLEKPDSNELDNIINGLQSSLFFKTASGSFAQVSTSRNGQWLLKNAPAGTYRIELAESFDNKGKVVKLSGDRTKTFNLPAGKRAQIQIILKKTPVGLIIVLSVVIVGLVILAILSKNDLPNIPLPPGHPGLIPPLPPIIRPLPLVLFFPLLPSRHEASNHEVRPQLPVPLFIDFGVYISPH